VVQNAALLLPRPPRSVQRLFVARADAAAAAAAMSVRAASDSVAD
jgi:hypothetical protein